MGFKNTFVVDDQGRETVYELPPNEEPLYNEDGSVANAIRILPLYMTIAKEDIHKSTDAIDILSPISFVEDPEAENYGTADSFGTFRFSNIEAKRSSGLPEGKKLEDMVEKDYLRYFKKQCEEAYGCSITDEGELGEGFSYVTISMDVKNLSDEETQYTKNVAGGDFSFARLDDTEGHYSYSRMHLSLTENPLSIDDIEAMDALYTFKPSETKRETVTYIVPDYLIEDPSLFFIIDGGISPVDVEKSTLRPQAFALADQM